MKGLYKLIPLTINNYESLDSLQNISNDVDDLTTDEFDITMLKQEKKKLIEELDRKEKTILFLCLGGGFSFLIISYIFYTNIIALRKELDVSINTNIETDVSKKSSKEILQISPDIIMMIKRKLNEFEEKNGFLDQDITQQTLAKILGTNSSYLSVFINYEKGVNFSTYLKDLRTTYAIKTLKANPEMVSKYTLKGLAETFGFKSAGSLAKAIANKTGVNASNYLKMIEETVSDAPE